MTHIWQILCLWNGWEEVARPNATSHAESMFAMRFWIYPKGVAAAVLHNHILVPPGRKLLKARYDLLINIDPARETGLSNSNLTTDRGTLCDLAKPGSLHRGKW